MKVSPSCDRLRRARCGAAWNSGPADFGQGYRSRGDAVPITMADGRVTPQEALPGTILLAFGDGSGRQRRFRIDSVERDPKDKDGEVMLYGLSEQDPESGEWRNACLPDPDGRRLGFPLAGRFTADGRYDPAPDKLLITCTGGAEGKCVRFGYKPWGKAGGGTSLQAARYNACVRLVRADYAGDGRGTTRNGMAGRHLRTLASRAPGARARLTNSRQASTKRERSACAM